MPPRLSKAAQSQNAAVADTARLRSARIAACRQLIGCAKLRAETHDFALREMLQRRLNNDAPSALRRSCCRSIRCRLKCSDEFGTTVRIARVVDGIHTNVEMCRPHALRIAECIAQKDEVARGYVCDRNIRPFRIALGHINRIIRQCRAADRVHIRLDHEVLRRMIVCRNPLCTVELTVMPLVIVEADRIEFIACCVSDRHAGTAVEPSRKQNYRLFPHVFPSHPRSEATAAAISFAP